MRSLLLTLNYVLLGSLVKTSHNAAPAQNLPKCKFSHPLSVATTRLKICVQASRQSMLYESCPEYQFRTGYIEGDVLGCFQQENMTTCTCTELSKCFADEVGLVVRVLLLSLLCSVKAV
ncbi:hypothetical protein Aduo_016470 [Ancylostoma duodenale]